MRRRAAKGYTLIELSVGLVLLGIVAVLVMRFGGLASQRIAETTAPQNLTQASQALMGFVAANHRLPCPDTSAAGDPGEGLENCGGAVVGRLPLRTLGLARADLRQVRYGVYRSAVVHLDVAADRFRPLVTTSQDAASIVLLDPLSLLGYTYSPKDLFYHVGGATAAEIFLAQVNGNDFCHALRLAGGAATDASGLNIRDVGGASVLKNVAYALALPGARDADGDGNAFDGSNRTAGSFAASGQAVSAAYDDVVQAVDFGQLFDNISCAGVLSAADHAHFNVATAAALTRAGFVDYKSQLQIAAEIASANNLLAIAGVATATADLLATTAGVSFAIAEGLITSGITAALVALAVLDEAGAIAAEALAIAGAVMTAIDWTAAIGAVNDFQVMLDESAALEISIRNNAIAADAAGLY